VVGGIIQVLLVENDILYGLACKLLGFCEKGRDNTEQVLKCDFREERGAETSRIVKIL
jgi:hypothetical protein